jgi:hypothetical protein
LPFNCSRYATELQREFDEFSRQYGKELNNLNITLGDLGASISNFSRVAHQFHERLDKIDKNQLIFLEATYFLLFIFNIVSILKGIIRCVCITTS